MLAFHSDVREGISLALPHWQVLATLYCANWRQDIGNKPVVWPQLRHTHTVTDEPTDMDGTICVLSPKLFECPPIDIVKSEKECHRINTTSSVVFP